MTGTDEIVQRWMALWNGDMQEMETLITPDVVVHAALIGQAGDAPLTGRDALRRWIETARSMLPEIRFGIEVGPLADGAMCAVRWRGEGPHGTRRISFTGTDILRIENGRIAEHWTNADTMLMMQQAGLA